MKFTIALIFTLMTQTVLSATLTIKFEQTAKIGGEILFAVFDDESEFPKGKSFATGSTTAKKGENSATGSIDLPPGDYVISAFLDENGNKKLDQGLFGIPTERFGFSQNPTILTGPPKFSKCVVKVDGDENITIKLITLTDQ